MYAITGITGKVGGALARTLLAANQLSAASFATPTKRGSGPDAVAKSPLRA